MTITKPRSTVSDMAVSGLFAGIAAGLFMLFYLLIVGWIGGEATGALLARFAPSGSGTPLLGLVTHLAVSGIYGAIFGGGLALTRGRISSWLAGFVYGLALYLVAQLAILPGFGAALTAIFPAHLLMAHLIFGATLGAFLRGKS